MQNPQNREEHYISEPSDHLSSIANVGASRSQRNGQGLDNILSSLNENYTSINSIIPNRYNFVDGVDAANTPYNIGYGFSGNVYGPMISTHEVDITSASAYTFEPFYMNAAGLIYKSVY